MSLAPSIATPLADDAAHILVIDDDRRIRELLQKFLRSKGFRVTVAADAAEARRKLDGMDFDLMVVDVMMPGETGLSLTRSISAERAIPVIMLTALAEADHRVAGLEAGADDYLPKPFDPRELVLRINNILKRNANPAAPKIDQLMFGPFTFSLVRKELRRGASPVKLTEREQDIMTIFALNAGQTVPRHELVGNDADVGERTIDVQINRLRRKIEDDPGNPVWLQTVRGIGYRLSLDQDR